MTREQAEQRIREAESRFRARIARVPLADREVLAIAMRRLGAETAAFEFARSLSLDEVAALLEAPPPPRPLAKARPNDARPEPPPPQDLEGDEYLRDHRARFWRSR